MYRINKKQYASMLLCMNAIGYVLAAPVVQDRDLSMDRPAVLVEKEVRSLEEDLKGTYGKSISEEDRILLSLMVRDHLNMMPYNDLRYNPSFVRTETQKVMVQYVAKRAYQHASTSGYGQIVAANAAKTEGNEFMNFIAKIPSRDVNKIYQYFGPTFEQRVKENAMNGKYGY